MAEPKIDTDTDPAGAVVEIAEAVTGDVPVPPAKKKTWKTRLLSVFRIVAVVAIVYFLVATTITQWGQVSATFRALSWTALILSTLAALGGIGANMMAWRAALADLDHRIPVRTAAPIALIGTLGKYVPGSVWAYVVQMELGRRAGVPRTRAFLASLVGTGIGVTVGLLIGVLGLPTAFEAASAAEPQHRVVGQVAFYAAIIALPFALVCAHPKIMTMLIGLVLRLLRRPRLDTSMSWRGTLETAGWATVAFVCFGTHLWLLAQTQTAQGFSGWARSFGVMALALSVSLFVVVAPSGIGVREFLVAVALTGFGVSYGTAYAIALASRLIFTFGDVAAAGLAAIFVRRLRVDRP